MAALTVTTSASLVLAASGNRTGFSFQNVSDTDIYVGNADSVTASEGANTGTLIKAGASFTNTPSDARLSAMQQAWYAIHGGAGDKTLLVNTY